MSKFTTTLKGLMALALGSFSLGASAAETAVAIDGATRLTAAPTADNNRDIVVIQSQNRGAFYAAIGGETDGVTSNQLVRVGPCSASGSGYDWGKSINLDNLGTDDHFKFAFITYGGHTYLYSLKAEGLVRRSTSTSGKLAEISSENATVRSQITFNAVSDGGLGYFQIAVNGTRINHGGGHAEDATLKGVVISGAGVDEGNRLVIQKLAGETLSDEHYNKAVAMIEGAIVAARNAAKAKIAGVEQFFYNKTDFQSYVSQIESATTEATINSVVNSVFDDLNGKLVYLKYAPKAGDTEHQYLGVQGYGDYRVAQLLPQRGTRAKWQLVRVSDDRFRLRNIASNTYIFGSDAGLTSAETTSFYDFVFLNNTAVEGGVTLKYYNPSSNNLLSITESRTVGGGTSGLPASSESYEYVLSHRSGANYQPNNANNAWIIEPVGVAAADIEDGYYVIRCNRGLTGSPNSNSYNTDGYDGSLLGVYTPDRTIARTNQGLNSGVHLRQYTTGMHTIWKIERNSDQQVGGFKIYSIIGEMEDGNNLGMHYNNNELVTLTSEPSIIYIRPVSEWDFENRVTSPIPNGVALSSDASNTSGNNCFDVRNSIDGNGTNGAFFVRANEWRPNGDNQKTNIGSIFYIERVSEYDVAQAKAAYIDYAQNTRSFELLKNVLTPEDKEYALSQKTTDPKTVNDIPSANKFLNEVAETDPKVSSTLAFERLEGKLVRFDNRRYAGVYLSDNEDGTQLFGSNSDSNLGNLWTVKVVNAGLRQIKLVNYKTNKYVGQLPVYDAEAAAATLVCPVSDEANAGIYTVSRYYSLDGKSFYANLLYNYESPTGVGRAYNALNCNGDNSYGVQGSTHAALGSHWTMLPAVADEVKDAAVQMSVATDNNSIIIEAPEGATSFAKTEGLGEHHQVKLTPVVAQAEEGINAQADAVEVVIPNDKVAVDGNRYVIDLTALDERPATSKYTLNFPTGYFTVNGKLAPAMSSELNVVDTTGIREVNVAEKGAEVIYDLQGRRVSKAGKGVYIINGVKTLVK